MKYTVKQINRILIIQDFLETVNTLSKIYNEFDNKEFTKVNITDKQRIYKVFCSSIYNLIVAIKNTKEIFENATKYIEFEELINKRYFANDKKYYNKENYESDLFKIIETIRHQNNHFQKDDDDNTILFEVYIDFNVLDELRKIVNQIFYEIYNKIDKESIKQTILEKPKIQYTFDKLSEKVDYIELKCRESKNEIDNIFAHDNERAIQILRECCNPNNVYNILNNDEDTMKKYDLFDKEMEKLFNKLDKYISENGDELQKEIMSLLKDLFANNESVTKNEYDKNVKEFADKLKELKGKSEERN